MLLLIIDFETTGLDPQTHFPIELGAILYSVEHQTTLAQASILIPVQDNPAQKVNRINAGAAQAAKNFQQDLLVPIGRWMQQADYLVAHNAEFDRKWIGLHGIPNSSKPWLCTYDDFVWTEAAKSKQNLVALALDYGIGVSSAHRALTDCQLIASLFSRVDNLNALVQDAIKRSQSWIVRIIATVLFEDKHLAKEREFQWNATEKIWYKDVRWCDFETSSRLTDFLNELPFKTSMLPLPPKNQTAISPDIPTNYDDIPF